MKTSLRPLMIAGALAACVLAAAASPVPAGEKDIAGLAKKVYPSVVRVEVQNHMRRVATGVVMDREGHIVTTALISPREEKITVALGDGRTSEAEFLGFDSETRLAVIRAKDKNLTPLDTGRVEDLAAGAWVAVVSISPESTPAVTQGIVSSVAGDRLRLNIWVTPGSSGGPVVDENGRMIGLLRGIYTDDRPVLFKFRDREQVGQGYVFSSAEAPSSGMAMAIPVDVVKSVYLQIKEKGKVERGWLGVGIAQDEKGRIEVTEVDPESPAELAKVREGDILLQIDDRPVTSTEVLASEVRRRRPGQDVTLKIERDGKETNVKVKLGEVPISEARRELELRFPGLFPDAPPPMTPPATPGRPSGPGTPAPATPAQPRAFSWSYEKRTFIGVYCDELGRELAEHFGIKEGLGLMVSRLVEKGPAEKAGVKVGDVIVRVDGKRIEALDALIDIIQDRKKGDKIKIEFLRDKKPLTLEIEVDEEERGGPQAFGQSSLEAWQKYADAFQQELRKWGADSGREAQDNMKRIQKELSRPGAAIAPEAKAMVREGARKI
jgi:serine protease Do